MCETEQRNYRIHTGIRIFWRCIRALWSKYYCKMWDISLSWRGVSRCISFIKYRNIVHKETDLDACHCLLEFGQCFLSGLISGGVLRNKASLESAYAFVLHTRAFLFGTRIWVGRYVEHAHAAIKYVSMHGWWNSFCIVFSESSFERVVVLCYRHSSFAGCC